MTTIETDAATRFLSGDWKGETIDSLKAKGFIKRDPANFLLWRCTTTDMAYTIGALQGAHTQARYSARTLALAEQQATKRTKKVGP